MIGERKQDTTGDNGNGIPRQRETTVSEQRTGYHRNGRPRIRETTGEGDQRQRKTLKQKKQERSSHLNFFLRRPETRPGMCWDTVGSYWGTVWETTGDQGRRPETMGDNRGPETRPGTYWDTVGAGGHGDPRLVPVFGVRL